MSMTVKFGGAWRVVNSLYVKTGGVWKVVTNGNVKSGGAWYQFFSAVATAILFPPPNSRDIDNLQSFTGIRTVSLTVNTDGTMSGTNYTGGNWIAPTGIGAGTGYYVRFRSTAGGNKSGSALNTWLPLTSTRTVNISNTNVAQISSGTLSVDLSR